MSESETRDSPFWRFSLRFYALPDVAPACLVLQDEAGVDVNLMLFLLYLAESGRTVTREEIAGLDAEVKEWRTKIVEPLRALRRKLKAGFGDVPLATSESLRTLVKKVELESERAEQTGLEQLAPNIGTPGAGRDGAAARNLAALAAFIGPLPDKEVQILLRAFTDAPPSPLSA